MRRRMLLACLFATLTFGWAWACSSDAPSSASATHGDAGNGDANAGGTEGGAGSAGAGAGAGARGGAGTGAGSNGGAVSAGGASGAGSDAGPACTPLDQVPKPSVLGVSMQSSCAMPTASCTSPLAGTSWGLSEVCLDASQLFPQAAARCSGVTYGSVIENDVHGSVSFTETTVDMDLTVDVTATFDFPNACHFCRCTDLETELLQAGLTSISCSPACSGSCNCTASASKTLRSSAAYTLTGGTLTSGSVVVNACAAKDKLSFEERSTGTVFTLLPRSRIDTPEICDGKDNDGNGKVDDNPVECPPCSTIGVCGNGVNPTCDGSKGWTCHYTSPSWQADETKCDHLDNDCDGQVDDNLPCREICDGKDNDGNGKVDDDPLDAPACTQAGVCQGMTAQCGGASGFSCVSGNPAFEAGETKCDGLDNDCNGVVDERCCAADSARVYYSYQVIGDSGLNGVVIERSKLDGSGREPIINLPPAYVIDVSLDPIGKKIYWASLLDNLIQRANLDGSSVEAALVGDNQPRVALDVAHRFIFWRGNGGVQRTSLDDLTKTTAILPGQLPMSMTVDSQDGWLFMADATSVSRANLDGSDLVTISGNAAVGYLIEGIAFDPVGRKLYWTGGGLYRANPDLSNSENLFALSYPVELHVAPVARRLYWSQTAANRIGWVTIGGTTPTYVDYPVEVICGEIVDCPP